MSATLWIARVLADDSYGVASVRELSSADNATWRAGNLSAQEFVIAAPTEEGAYAIAQRILRRARARAELGAGSDAERRGYTRCLNDLAAQLDELRGRSPRPATTDLDPENIADVGRWFGREDMLDTIERWAIAMRPREES